MQRQSRAVSKKAMDKKAAPQNSGQNNLLPIETCMTNLDIWSWSVLDTEGRRRKGRNDVEPALNSVHTTKRKPKSTAIEMPEKHSPRSHNFAIRTRRKS